MTEEIHSKEDVSLDAVAALAASRGIAIGPDRIDVIAQRLGELFDLAAPLEEAVVEDFKVTQPFDPRWTEEGAG